MLPINVVKSQLKKKMLEAVPEQMCMFEYLKYDKQLLDEAFVICRIINVEVRVINKS